MHQVPIDEYVRRLKSDPHAGLSAAEAELRLRKWLLRRRTERVSRAGCGVA